MTLPIRLAAYVCLSAGASAEDPLVGPYLQRITSDGVTVMWETGQPCVGRVRFGPPGRLSQERGESEPRTVHQIRLDALEPATRYAYRIEWEGGAAGPFEFVSGPPIGTKNLRIAVYGDSRTNSEIHRRVVSVMARYDPQIVLNSGDLVSDGLIYAQWKPQFFDPLATLIRSVPIFTILGNHERNSEHYFNYFDLPGNEAWWSTDYGNIHLIGLDSNQPLGPGSEQYRWLESDLRKTNDRQWIVAFFHHPMFSAHPTRPVHANRWAWQPLFQQYGVDLVFTGHDHHYQRCYPIGTLTGSGRSVVHLTTGGGGAGLYPVHEYPWTEVARSVHNLTILDFSAAEVHVRAFSERGESIDDVIIRKDARTQPQRLVAYEAVVWERDVRRMFEKAGQIEVRGSEVHAQRTLVFPSSFPRDLKVLPKWTTSEHWRIKGLDGPFVLKARDGARAEMTVEATWPDCYPTPELTFELLTRDGERLFRNNVFRLSPLRIWPRRTLHIPGAAAPIQIDAEPAEWEGVSQVATFIVDRGDRLPAAQTRVRVQRDAEGLSVFAFIDMSDHRQFGQGDTSRDAWGILNRDESFSVHLGVGDDVYTFGVNTRNTRFDARGTDRAYNTKFETAVAKAAATWYCEMRIPREAWNGTLERINFVRYDGQTRTRSAWVPTFGQIFDAARYAFIAP